MSFRPSLWFCSLQFQAVKVPYPKDTYSEKITQQEKDFVSTATSVYGVPSPKMTALLHATPSLYLGWGK